MGLVHLAARLSGERARYWALALTFTPLGGAGLFLGLSATTVKLLRYEGLLLDWVQPARGALLVGAIGWCLWLAWKQLADTPLARHCAAWTCLLLGNGLVGYGWWLQFWGWNL